MDIFNYSLLHITSDFSSTIPPFCIFSSFPAQTVDDSTQEDMEKPNLPETKFNPEEIGLPFTTHEERILVIVGKSK